MLSAEILNREQNVTDTAVIEFNTEQCLCAVTSLLFTGSFAPNTFVPSTNLSITVELNKQESLILLNQSIRMTSSLNIFRYQIQMPIDVNSVQLSIDGGVVLYLNENDSPLIVLGKLIVITNYKLYRHNCKTLTSVECCKENEENEANNLAQTSLFIDNIEERISNNRLLLFPTMTFQRSGNISSWSFTARREIIGPGISQIEFQVWSPEINCDTMMTEYRKIGQNTISVADLKPTGFQNLFKYQVPLSNQISVVKDDVFAVLQTKGDEFSLVFVTEIGHLAYESHPRDINKGLVEFEPTSDSLYLFPLVTFNLTESGAYTV